MANSQLVWSGYNYYRVDIFNEESQKNKIATLSYYLL